MDTQQYIYLYDLPKQFVSSVQLAQAFKDKAGVTLADSQKPQIKKDLTKPFYRAMVNIKDPDQFKQACEKMRYFDIEGKPCRALPFDRQLLGSNKEKLLAQNVFVRSIPKNMKHEDMHQVYSQFGPIKSLKISLNPDYSSRGYGFVCFETAEAATAALESKALKDMQVIKFEAKDNKSNMRKLMNNIYVKNLPVEYTNDDVKKLFGAYGNIKSLVLKKNEIGQFGFVCYDDANPDSRDKEYGPRCAANAIDGLNNKALLEGDKAPRLVVRHALKESERAAEKMRETIRYKTSKKRCNLYVKNFPNNYKKDDLIKLFCQFGDIENVRLDKGKSGNAFAFVCFKEPTDAAKAKQNLHNYTIEGKQLVICYYEIKELRQLQNEEAKDKADWERYQANQTGGFQWNELTQLPNLTQILTTLMQVIHMHEQKNATNNQQERMQYRHAGKRQGGPMQNNRMNQGGYQNQGGQQQMPNQQMGNMNMPQAQMGGMPQPPMGGMPQARVPQQMQPQPPMGGMPAPAMNMPQAPQAPQQPAGGANAGIVQNYTMKAMKILPAVQEGNPYLQEQVGQCIFEFILQMVGQDMAPKITGMLIDLPVPQIKQYLSSYHNLEMKVQEARDHLRQTMGDK